MELLKIFRKREYSSFDRAMKESKEEVKKYHGSGKKKKERLKFLWDQWEKKKIVKIEDLNKGVKNGEISR